MRIGRLEVGVAPLGFEIIPSGFLHKNVAFEDEVFADEYGLFWLGFRVSLYLGTKTYGQVKADRLKNRN